LPRDVVRDPEVRQRLAQIEIGLAGREDAEPRWAAVEHDPVELVGAGEGGDGLHFRAMQPALLRQRRIRPAHPQPAGGGAKSSGVTISIRDGSPKIDAELSTVSEMALKPTQQPE
jgi:hypothetical protein